MPDNAWKWMGLLGVVSAMLLTGCATGYHGSFSESTFFDRDRYTNTRELGTVQGISGQNMLFYVLPLGSPPSTYDAVQQALNEKEDTVFLANVAVEERQHWYIGYSKVCIYVTGTACSADKKEPEEKP